MAVLVKTPAWTGPAIAAAGTASGIWLMVAPALFGYVGSPAEISQRIAGPLIALLWIVSAWDVTRSVRWWTYPPALWLLLEPAVIGEPADASVNALAVGALSIAGALVANDGRIRKKYAGGWIGLWSKTPPGPGAVPAR